MIELIYGGSGSGKSAYAEKRVMELNNTWKYYVATMQVYDEEGQAKVERHRQLRAGKGFVTVEQCRNLGALAENAVSAEAAGGIGNFEGYLNCVKGGRNLKIQVLDSCALVECLSNLVANEMFCTEETVAADVGNGVEEKEVPDCVYENAFVEKILADIRKLAVCVENLVIVSNNIFEDGIEYEESTQKYMSVLGLLNCNIAEIADRVVEVVVGIPVEIKGVAK